MDRDDEEAKRRAGAAVFAQDEVVACYYARPPYAPEMLDFLIGLARGRSRALDVGCGPGKVAILLADHFEEVVALDPSAPMIAAGKAADAGRHGNIAWVRRMAEDYDSDGGFDLVTAGSSIHWTDPAKLFPKLARWTHLLALLNDSPIFPAPAPPCGHEAWVDFLTLWFGRTGRQAPAAWRCPDPAAASSLGRYGDWIDVVGCRRFTHTVHQSVGDFVTGNHSRVSWSSRMMGPAAVAAFDRELEELMRPFARQGMLELEVLSELTWGVPRATPRD